MKAQIMCRIPRKHWNEVHDMLALPSEITMQFFEPVAHEDPHKILITSSKEHTNLMQAHWSDYLKRNLSSGFAKTKERN